MNKPDTAQQPNGWEMACRSASPLRFIDFNLRGIGQVLFQDNPLSGLFFFAAIGWGSFMAGALEVAIAGLLALLVASLTALWLRVETAPLHAGLYGFNAYLLGIALATFLDPSPLLWAYAVLGGAVSVIATLAATRVMQTWGLSALTAPFILITWLLLLSSNGFSSVPAGALPTSGLIQPIPAEAADPLRILDFLQGILISISQVFVKGDGIAALLILTGLAIGSITAAGYALAAALISVIVAHLLGAESQLITGGLVGFNPILTAIAVGSVFARPSLRSGLYALFATVITVLVQGAMASAVTPFAIPTLTASFVLVTWLFLLAKPNRIEV